VPETHSEGLRHKMNKNVSVQQIGVVHYDNLSSNCDTSSSVSNSGHRPLTMSAIVLPSGIGVGGREVFVNSSRTLLWSSAVKLANQFSSFLSESLNWGMESSTVKLTILSSGMSSALKGRSTPSL
jgi:hypothetical protein